MMVEDKVSFIKKTKIILIVFLSFILSLNVRNYFDFFQDGMQGKTDFGAFYLAGKIFLSGNIGQIFDLDIQRLFSPYVHSSGNFLPFFHPPFEAIIFAPFSIFSIEKSFVLWNIFSFILLLISLFFVLEMENRNKIHKIFVLLVTLNFFPTIATFINGQDSILFLFLLTFSLKYLCEEKDLLSGILLGLSVFKPHLTLPFAFLMGIFKFNKFTIGFFISSGLMFIISLFMVGISGIQDLFSMISSVNSEPSTYGVNANIMLNVRGIFDRHFSIIPFKVNYILWLLLNISFIFIPKKNKLSPFVIASLAIPTILLFSIHGHYHDFILLLLPIILSLDFVESGYLKEGVNFEIGSLCFLLLFLVTPTLFTLHSNNPGLEIFPLSVVILFVILFRKSLASKIVN